MGNGLGICLSVKVEVSPTLLFDAVVSGDVAKVRRCLDNGVAVDVRNKDSETPLHVAAQQSPASTAVVQLLLERGAPPNSLGKHSKTPLQYAAKSGATEVVKLLLEHGADAGAKAQNDVTALHSASSRGGNIDVVRLLLDAGAEVNAQDRGDSAPLHRAAGNGRTEVARLLLDRGADVHIKGWHLWTPLHYAAFQGSVELVQLLLDAGADTTAVEQEGARPLEIARRERKHECAEFLAEHTPTTSNGVAYPSCPNGLMQNGGSLHGGSHHGGSQHGLMQQPGGGSSKSLPRSELLLPQLNPLKSFLTDTSTSSLRSIMSSGPRDGMPSSGGFVPTAELIEERASHEGAGGEAVAQVESLVVDHALWGSMELTEQRLMQHLKEGATFGDSGRYRVRSANAFSNGGAVGCVQDTLEGRDYFVKFVAKQATFAAECEFYLFWRNMAAELEGQRRADVAKNLRKTANEAWPVLKEIFERGHLQPIREACLVMEQGTLTLDQRLRNYSKQGVEAESRARPLLIVFENAARALSLMHEYGWVHRDIKPDNIMYFLDIDRWKLVDFGIAARAGESVAVHYSLPYASPEAVHAHFNGQSTVVAHSSMDMWSLGMTMLYSFASEKPFQDCGEKEWFSLLLNLRKFPFEEDPTWFERVLPTCVQDICRDLLQRDPDKRMKVGELLRKRVFKSPDCTRDAASHEQQQVLQEISVIRALNAQGMMLSMHNHLLVCVTLLHLPWAAHGDVGEIDHDWYLSHCYQLEEVIVRCDDDSEKRSHYALTMPPHALTDGNEPNFRGEPSDVDGAWLHFVSISVFCVTGENKDKLELPVKNECSVSIAPEGASYRASTPLQVLVCEKNETELRTVALWPVGHAQTPWLADAMHTGELQRLSLHIKLQMMQGGMPMQELVRKQTLTVAAYPYGTVFTLDRLTEAARNMRDHMPPWLRTTANTIAFCVDMGERLGLDPISLLRAA